MTMIPEELKNSKCCLKCSEFNPKTYKVNLIGSEYQKCEKCRQYTYSYNQIAGKITSWIGGVLVAVVIFPMLCNSIATPFDKDISSIPILPIMVLIQIFIMIIFYRVGLNNESRQKKIKSILQKHMNESSDNCYWINLNKMTTFRSGSSDEVTLSAKP